MRAPKTFVSYSWDDDQHKAWVRELATSLRKDGVDVTLDQWHVQPGDQLPAFMEQAIRESDFVLIVCTPKYKAKADERSKGGGGVGYEGDVIQGEVFTRHNHRKFIPILRKGSWIDSAPSQLLGKAYIGMQNEEMFRSNYPLLLRTLHGISDTIPEVGSKPDFLFAPSLRAHAEDQKHAGLAAGGTVIRHGGNKTFVGKNFGISFSRDFQGMLDIAETSDFATMPRVSADQIKRIDFKPYSAGESELIKKLDRHSVINCTPGWSRFRRATIERLDNTTEDVFLVCTETLYGPEGESYALGNTSIQAVASTHIREDAQSANKLAPLPELTSISFADGLTGWIGGLHGTLLKTENGGLNWSVQGTEFSSGPINALRFIDCVQGWAAGWDEDLGSWLCHTPNGGLRWQLLFSSQGRRVGAPKGLAVAVKEHHLEDALQVLTGVRTGQFSNILFVNARAGWVASGATLFTTGDGGRSWQTHELHVSARTVYLVDETTGWVGGDDGRIYRTTDAAKSWQCQRDTKGAQPNYSETITSIWMLDRTVGWAVGYGGLVLATKNGGKEWTRIEIAGFGGCHWNRILFLNERTGFIAGQGLLATDDGGVHWRDIRPPDSGRKWLVDMCAVENESGVQSVYALSADGRLVEVANADDNLSSSRVTVKSVLPKADEDLPLTRI